MKCALCFERAYKAPPKGGAPTCLRCAEEIQEAFFEEEFEPEICGGDTDDIPHHEWWMS